MRMDAGFSNLRKSAKPARDANLLFHRIDIKYFLVVIVQLITYNEWQAGLWMGIS